MAIYHLHVGVVSRSSGRSAVAAAAYRAGEKLHNEYDGITHDYRGRNSVEAAAYRSGESLTHDGKTHDFTNKRGVVYSEIMLPENAPSEYKDRSTLWNAIEKAEKRHDAQTARDIDVALPVEFNRREQIDIMREYIQENFIDKGMIADFAIHDKNDGNPHAHIMLTMRNISDKGFGNKNREWNKPEYLQGWRENWAEVCNEKLHKKGLDKRIDHRTLEAQGIDREPTIHIGVTAKAMAKKGHNPDRLREHGEIVARNKEREKANNPENTAEYMHELEHGYAILDKEITELRHENVEAEREMRILKNQAEQIHERWLSIRNLDKRLYELREERRKMSLLKSKKFIDSSINQLERAREQAGNAFKSQYKITPDQADAEIKRLEYRVRSYEHLRAKLREKINPLVAERNVFELEYRRLALQVEIDHEKEEMDLVKPLYRKILPYKREIENVRTQRRVIERTR